MEFDFLVADTLRVILVNRVLGQILIQHFQSADFSGIFRLARQTTFRVSL